MIEAVATIQKYFQPPQNYFWKWGDNGEVIEWANGSTICYRDELLAILQDLSNEGFPSVSPMLLVLSACRENIRLQHIDLLLKTGRPFEDEALNILLKDVIDFLTIVQALPANLRTGKQRIHLMYIVFEQAGFVYSKDDLKDAVNELNSGRIDGLVFRPGEPVTKEQLKRDWQYLSDALKRFPTAERLELKLRTGLHDIPGAAEVTLPENSPSELFDQLAEDPKTLGISRLTKRLIAALNIPMHSQGSGDQSYGGISDITNRGNYDKLLLSELAHDDLSLTARLVNNEALYYRREEPPDNPKRQRTILLDSTLKMWGVPRVFALCAALACTHNTKHGELVEARILSSDEYTPADLYTKQGILQSQEILHHALHCGKALQAALANISNPGTNDLIFITDASLLNSPAFHAYFSQAKNLLNFILTVSRNGELHFYECSKGGTKLLSTAKFDLEELLFKTQVALPLPQQYTDYDGWYPVFLSQMPPPLLFPVVKIKRAYDRFIGVEGRGVVVVNQAHRLLYIKEKGKGAVELLSLIERGAYTFGIVNARQVFVLVNNYQRNFVKLYAINLETGGIEIKALPLEFQKIKSSYFKRGKLLVDTDLSFFTYDCLSGELFDNKSRLEEAKLDTIDRITGVSESDKVLLNGFISVYYSAMYKIKEIAISKAERKLLLGNYVLDLTGQNEGIRIIEMTKTYQRGKTAKEQSVVSLLNNKESKFKRFKWDDGSEILLDNRGVIHLKSSDMLIPEISIISVTGRNTTCWASNAVAAGDGYFMDKAKVITIQDFYDQYIQKYIDVIMNT